MAVIVSVNYTAAGTNFSYQTADGDSTASFRPIGQAFEEHNHASARGLGVLRIQTGTVPAAAGEVRVNSEDLQWYGTALQTALRLANAQTVTGTKTFSNTADAASSQISIFEGDRATPTTNDEAYLSLRLSDSAGNQDEFARLTWVGVDVLSTSEDGRLELDLIIAGTLTRVAYFEGRTLVIDQVTGDVTLSFADPTANRTLTVPDPGANDTFVFLAATQTLTNKTLTAPTMTINDASLTIRDDLDITKQFRFQASAITAGTTRTLTIPDADTTLVGTDVTQTLTNKTLTTPTIAATGWANANHAHAAANSGGTLDAAAIATGTVATARLGSGAASSSVFLRGDQTWAAVASGLTRAGGNTTEATSTTVTTPADLLTVSTLSLTAATPVLILLNLRQGTGALSDIRSRLKVNTTVINLSDDANTIADVFTWPVTGGSPDAVKQSQAKIVIGPRVTNHVRALHILIAGSSGSVARVVSGGVTNTDIPIATITDLIYQGANGGSGTTIGADEMQVYNYGTS